MTAARHAAPTPAAIRVATSGGHPTECAIRPDLRRGATSRSVPAVVGVRVLFGTAAVPA